MLSLNQKRTSELEKKTSSVSAVFAKAIDRLNQPELKQEQVKLDEMNRVLTKKIEPSLEDTEEKIWALWKNLLKDSQVS